MAGHFLSYFQIWHSHYTTTSARYNHLPHIANHLSLELLNWYNFLLSRVQFLTYHFHLNWLFLHMCQLNTLAADKEGTNLSSVKCVLTFDCCKGRRKFQASPGISTTGKSITWKVYTAYCHFEGLQSARI